MSGSTADAPTESAWVPSTFSAWLSSCSHRSPRRSPAPRRASRPDSPRRSRRDTTVLTWSTCRRDPLRRPGRRQPRASASPEVSSARSATPTCRRSTSGRHAVLAGPGLQRQRRPSGWTERRSPRRRSGTRAGLAGRGTPPQQPDRPAGAAPGTRRPARSATWSRSTATATSSGSTTYETKSTSLVVPDPLASGDWFWRVVAAKDNNLKSRPSAARSFVISAIAAPVITSPPDNADFELQRRRPRLEPVPGAVSYEVEVATNTDFSQGSADRAPHGHHRHPLLPGDHLRQQPVLLARPRHRHRRPADAVDPRRATTSTAPGRRSRRRLPGDAPGPRRCPHPLYFQWTPVAHASEYEFQIGTQENFSVGTFNELPRGGHDVHARHVRHQHHRHPDPVRENEDC